MNERFHIFRNIQTDRYTRVDIVQDQITGKCCISKQIRKEAGGLLLHQFKTEIDVLSRVHHPYIPEIIDVCETDHHLILVETYIDGMHLDTWLKRNRWQVFKHRSQVFLELVHEMEQVHHLHYLYVDLKPANILIKNNHAYLIDFNSCIEMTSKQIISASSFNVLHKKLPCDKTVDIFSLGKILQLLYPCDIFKRMVGKGCMTYRISDGASLRFWFIFTNWMKRTFICVCIFILSVFFINNTFANKEHSLDRYLKHPSAQTFMPAYQYTYRQWNQSSYDTLYQWITHHWISKDVYNDNQLAAFLMEQAIQTSNAEMCSYIIRKIPWQTKAKHMDLYLQIKQICEPSLHLSKRWIHAYLDWCYAQKPTNKNNQKLLEALIQNQAVMSKEDARRLKHLYETQSPNRRQDGLFFEYYLYLKGYLEMEIDLSDGFLHRYSDSEWTKLVKIWREL